ncbi:MAG: penicillin-binding protein activator [candidate division WOR-3 bacterium]
MNKRKIWLIVLAIIIIAVIFIGIRFTQKPSQKEQVIKIGAILPLTGDFALFGGWLKEGIDFAVEQEPNIKVIIEDNANQTLKAVSAYQKLINIDRVQAVITARTPVANALTPVANSSRVFTVFTFADLPKGDKTYILNYHFPVADEVNALVEFAYKQLGQKGAILVVSDDFGRLGADLFKQAFEKLGGNIVYNEQFSATEKDFRSLLLKLRNAKPDFIFVIAWEQNFVALTKDMTELGLSLPIIGPNVLTIYLNLVGPYLQRGYFTMSLYDAGKSTGAHYEEFLTRFKLEKGKEPNMVIAEAYEATKLLITALKQQPNDLPGFFDKLHENIGIFGKIVIDSERQAHFPLAVVEIEKGQKKNIVWEFTPEIRR